MSWIWASRKLLCRLRPRRASRKCAAGKERRCLLLLSCSISLGGRKTSVTLEDEFWDALRVIAQRDKTTLVSLVHQINQTRNQSNLSSAIRVFVLKTSYNRDGSGKGKADPFDRRGGVGFGPQTGFAGPGSVMSGRSAAFRSWAAG